MKIRVDYVGHETEVVEVTDNTTIRELIDMTAAKMDVSAQFLRVEYVQLNTMAEPAGA